MSEFDITYETVKNDRTEFNRGLLRNSNFINVNLNTIMNDRHTIIICFNKPINVDFSEIEEKSFDNEHITKLFTDKFRRSDVIDIPNPKGEIIEIYKDKEFKLLFETEPFMFLKPSHLKIYFSPNSQFRIAYVQSNNKTLIVNTIQRLLDCIYENIYISCRHHRLDNRCLHECNWLNECVCYKCPLRKVEKCLKINNCDGMLDEFKKLRI